MGWTLLESQAETGIEKRTICKILRDSLHQPKITSKWVPYALTEVENGHGMQYVIYKFFFKIIHPRSPNTIYFHLYISMCLHVLSMLPKKIVVMT
jgi:hypothetical protein